MQIKQTKGNRLFFENGYVQIKPNGNDLIFVVVLDSGKTHCPDTLEEAMDILKTKELDILRDQDIPPNTTILDK